jgi:D-alanyl-D-alanine carboxypeptidase
MRMTGRSTLGSSPLGPTILAAAVAAFALVSVPGSAGAGPALVVDAASGAVLHQEEATRPWYPASLSKLMTAYTVFRAIRDGRLDLDTPIVISARAARMAPSKIGYPPGTLVSVDDALKMLMVQSANDIAVALAEGVSGSVEAFAVEMNARSRALGMLQSHWVNPNGLPDTAQVSSARDMAVLARAILGEFPQYAGLFRIHAIQSGKRIMRTHNSLVYRYPGADGMKTGFICASGFNVVATATRNGRKLITVVLGSPSVKDRTKEAADLFEDGFRSAGGGFYSAATTIDDLPRSPYTTATEIREIACSRRKGATAASQEEETADVAPGPGPKGDGVMAVLLAQRGGGPSTDPSSPLLTSWVLDPPVQVGPYTGPRKPTAVAAGGNDVPAAATSYADPAPGALVPAKTAPGKPVVLPDEPAGGLPPALGAIRAGTAPADPSAGPLPGQIRRASANPLEDLASDPLPAAKPAVTPLAKKPLVKKPVAKKQIAKKQIANKPAAKPVVQPATTAAAKPAATVPPVPAITADAVPSPVARPPRKRKVEPQG